MKTFTPSVKPHLPHIFSYFLSDCVSLFKHVLVSPILKVKIKNQKTSLGLLSLSSLSPRQCSSLLHGHISQKSYLKQAVSISSHSIFSQFPCNLKFHPCQRKSTETVFVIISLYVATSDKNVHVFIFMRLCSFCTTEYSLLALDSYDSKTPLDFLLSHCLFLLHILYFLLFYLTFICQDFIFHFVGNIHLLQL